MSFAEAIKTCFNKYATFSGRARRSEYWRFCLFVWLCYFGVAFLVGLVVGLCQAMTGFSQVSEYAGGGITAVIARVMIIVSAVFLLPSLAVQVRRLHDTGRSGWWIILGLIPCVSVVGGIVLLVFYLLDSDPDENEYGPSPKYQVSEEETTIEQ